MYVYIKKNEKCLECILISQKIWKKVMKKNISKLLRKHILCLFLGLIDYKKKLISEKESKKKIAIFLRNIFQIQHLIFFPTIYAHYLQRWIGKRSSVHKCHTTISWNSYACQINCILGKTRLIWRTSFAFYGRQEAFRWESSQFRFFFEGGLKLMG